MTGKASGKAGGARRAGVAPRVYPPGFFTQVVRDWAQMRWQPNAELLAAKAFDAQRQAASAKGRAAAAEVNRQFNAREGQTPLPCALPAEVPRRGRPRGHAPVRRPPGEGVR